MGRYAGFYALITVGLLIAVVVSRSFDDDGRLSIGRTSWVAPPAELVTENGVRELVIEAGPHGSFLTEIDVDGASVVALVDTGASFLTLRESDANRAGLYPSRNDFTHQFSTANGAVMAAREEARTVHLGPGRVDNVTVFILPDDRLDVSLLGMNVLRRYGSVSFEADRLTIAVE